MRAFSEFGPDEIEQSVSYGFDQQAEKSPDRLAVKSLNGELTYRALSQAANRLAREILACRGPGEEPIALLFKEDALSMIIAMLGVWKAGKFYVVLSPASPPARNVYVLSDSQAGLLLTDSRNLSLARELTDQVLNIDALEPSLSEESLGLTITSESKAYLVYTSGSAGQPKGVLIGHRRLLQRAIVYADACHLSADDRVLQLLSFGFAAAWTPVCATLLRGASLFLHDVREQGVDNLAQWMLQEEITVCTSVTSTFRHFVSTLTGTEGFPRLRVILAGGEPLYKRDVEVYKTHFPPTCTLINEMGAAEVGRFLHYSIDSATEIEDHAVPLGYPLPDMDVRLVDEAGEPVGVGEIGEIAVRSRYLALGYWRKPGLTQALFRPDPKDAEFRIYYTGDLGRERPDGAIEHVGRTDFQVKIRGQRVELGEIELALLDHREIKEAVVVAREDPDGDKRLVAYIVSDRSPRPTGTELRTWLRQTLPEYMIPSAFVALDALPLTPSGKVDRTRLPAPTETQPDLAEGSAAPRDETELQLAEIWARVFDIPSVSPKDDFFELGGDSLIATTLFLEIERVFGKKLPVTVLLQAPTVEQLAELLRHAEQWVDESPLVAMQPGGSRPPLFLVHIFGGTLLAYKELASLLGPDQPVYGLQPKGQDGTDVPHSRMEDMAAHYVTAIRAVQPVGPYSLGGYCYSGVVAFEMARQLEAEGEQVALLAVFDGPAPSQARVRLPIWHPRFAIGFLRNLPGWLRDNLPGRSGTLVKRTVIRLRGRVRKTWRTWQGPRGTLDGQALLDDFMGDTSQFSDGRREMMAAHVLALRTYQPQVYRGRLTLFRVRTLPLSFPYDPELGWGRWAAGGVEVNIVSGHHTSLLQKPYVESLAAQLQASLASSANGPDLATP